MLTIRNLSKTYANGVKALDDVSLDIPNGMFGLLGPNGAGKSSLMRTIATLQDADTGTIEFDGGDVKLDVLGDKDGVRRIGCDGGMNALMRPAMYEAYHGIFNLSRDDANGAAVFEVVGPVCESSDVIGRGRTLPADTAEGDVILVADAGAYGMAMANTYNLRALPAEDIIE